MERDINGVSENQSGLGLVIDYLYGFFFESRKQQYVVYGVSFLIAFSYAILSDLALGKPQHEVVIESIVLASVLLICLPLAFVFRSIRRVERSQTKLHSRESLAWAEAVREPSFDFLSAAFRAHTAELTNVLRTLQNNEERQRQTQDLLATAISGIESAQQQIPFAIRDIARTISESQHTQLQDHLKGIAEQLQESISASLSVAFEQSNTHLVAMLSDAIEQHNHDFLRMLSDALEQQIGSLSTFQVPESIESPSRIRLRSVGYRLDVSNLD